MFTVLVLFYAGLVRLGRAAYSLQHDYDSRNWVDMFHFDTFDDPTHGYVNYVDQDTAQSSGLFKTDNNAVTFGSDSTSVASGRGRNSVRMTSKNQYTHGLFVVDIAHMPGHECGVWPAFWMTGPDWPNNGEIDIVEGVNLQSGNRATLHTKHGCSFDGSSCFGHLGCSKPAGGAHAYGDGLNAHHGGIYAVEWTADFINLWFFGRGGEPKYGWGDAPDPSRWGPPTTTFAGGNGCDIDSHFRNQRIVFDTTFCEGDWAGQVFHHDSTCAATASSCEDYVKYNPQAFADAYWTINSLRVYSENGLAQRVVSPRDNTPEFVSPLAVSTPGISTSPSLPFAPEAVVPETTPIDSVFNTSLPARHGHSHGDHGSLGGSKHSPKRKRNHRAARHLKHHMSRIYR